MKHKYQKQKKHSQLYHSEHDFIYLSWTWLTFKHVFRLWCHRFLRFHIRLWPCWPFHMFLFLAHRLQLCVICWTLPSEPGMLDKVRSNMLGKGKFADHLTQKHIFAWQSTRMHQGYFWPLFHVCLTFAFCCNFVHSVHSLCFKELLKHCCLLTILPS